MADLLAHDRSEETVGQLYQEMSIVSDLTEAVRQLADYHVKSPALLMRTPGSGYEVSVDRVWDDVVRHRCVITRSELGILMWRNGLRREELADPANVAKLAAQVAVFRPPSREDEPG